MTCQCVFLKKEAALLTTANLQKHQFLQMQQRTFLKKNFAHGPYFSSPFPKQTLYVCSILGGRLQEKRQ